MICKLIGKSLYQWDINRQIEFIKPDEIDEVHFALDNDEIALVVDPLQDGDNIVANIPNILLQKNTMLNVF